MRWMLRGGSELSVVVLPLGPWGDGFDGVPVLDDFCVREAEEVVEGGVDAGEGAFADGEDE